MLKVSCFAFMSVFSFLVYGMQRVEADKLSALQTEMERLEEEILERNKQDRTALPETSGRRIVGEAIPEKEGSQEGPSVLKPLEKMEEKKKQTFVQSRTDTRKYKSYSSGESPYTRKSSGIGSFTK